jgi:hypothetical protein
VADAPVNLDAPRVMVWHTTETDEVPAYRPNSAPHFTIPDDEPALYQHVNLGRIGNALRHSQPPETNAICLIQVEQVARSSVGSEKQGATGPHCLACHVREAGVRCSQAASL